MQVYRVIIWDNAGERREHEVDALEDALTYARFCRSLRACSSRRKSLLTADE